jgi:hypothetical protein
MMMLNHCYYRAKTPAGANRILPFLLLYFSSSLPGSSFLPRSSSLLAAVFLQLLRNRIVIQYIARDADALCFPVEPDSTRAVMNPVSTDLRIDRGVLAEDSK